MQSEQATERRQSSYELIDHMFNERRQLLALLFQVSTVGPNGVNTPDADLLEEFCQVLVDYIAAGHFGLYERIAEGKERRKAVANLAQKVYEQIEGTTQIALEFSEKYNSDQESINFDNLQED
ncbi:MAG: Rsd/AlgQ family anti-sigma factor, partial [Gammaproteobacteria bacterium]